MIAYMLVIFCLTQQMHNIGLYNPKDIADSVRCKVHHRC